jgi:multimeric flavodoxin WrbA
VKVLGIVGSMRKGRNTEILVRRVISEMTSIDPLVTSDLIHVSDLDIHPCRVVCHDANCSTHLFQCSITDDVQMVLGKMKDSDAIVVGAPHYFRM